MMEPVTIGPATLYLGDAREIVPTLKGVDCVVTDPPYGIDYGNAGGFCESAGWNQWKGTAEWDKERPPREAFEMILAMDVPTVIWGGNYFTDYLPPRMGWISWDKGQRDFSLADFELAWTSEQKAARAVVYPRGKANQEVKIHPTQKPVWLISQCIKYLQRGRKKPLATVLDPFAGSFTTSVAATRLGLRSICIEKDAEYFEKGVRRIREAVKADRDSLFPAFDREVVAC